MGSWGRKLRSESPIAPTTHSPTPLPFPTEMLRVILVGLTCSQWHMAHIRKALWHCATHPCVSLTSQVRREEFGINRRFLLAVLVILMCLRVFWNRNSGVSRFFHWALILVHCSLNIRIATSSGRFTVGASLDFLLDSETLTRDIQVTWSASLRSHPCRRVLILC
jgi:hypothetical protein